jgi:hypothetical protein
MATHQTHIPAPSVHELEEALSDVDFPLDKEALVRCIEPGRGADDPVVRQLRALPLATYESVAEVLRSVDLRDQRG